MDPTAPQNQPDSLPQHDPNLPPPHPPEADTPPMPTPVGAEPFVESFTEPVAPVITQPQPEPINPAPSPMPPADPPSSPAKKRSILPVLLLLIIVAGVAAAGVFFWPQIQQQLLSKSTPNPTPELTSPMLSPSPESVPDSALVYLKDSDIWMGEQKLSTSSAVTKYQHQANLNYVVYIEGAKQLLASGQTVIEANKVVHLNTTTKESKTLFELAPTSPFTSSPDYKVMIRDIGTSADGQLIVITTSDSIFTYSVATGQLEKVYENKLANVNANSVWGMNNPIISPDNKTILLTLGHYEGSSQALFTIENKTLKELPYTAYISGEKAIGWINNTDLLVVSYTDQTADTVETTLLRVPADTLTQTQIAKVPYGWIDIKVDSNSAYMIGTSSVAAGTGENNIPLFDRFNHLLQINLATGQQTELHKLQTEDSKVQETEVKSLSGIKMSNDPGTLLINVSIWRQPPAQSQTDVYTLNTATKAFNLTQPNAVVY